MAKKQKYQISYTLKDQTKPLLGRESFSSKKEASKWLKENEGLLYWYQLTEINPKSKLPRPLIDFEPGNEYTVKSGTLQTYYETGMECIGLVFYEDGVHGGPNPDFDPSKPESRSNFRYYSSYDGLHFIEHGMIVEINGKKIGMIKDRDFAKRDGYRLSFYPAGFSRKELIELFGSENIKVRAWIKKESKK